MRPLLILKTGTAVASVLAALGYFEDWFSVGQGARLQIWSSSTTSKCIKDKLINTVTAPRKNNIVGVFQA